MICVVGDFDPSNLTHIATSDALIGLPDHTSFEWIGTHQVMSRSDRFDEFGGFFIAPASPYRDMGAVLDVIRYARERGVPLVGT